eukprot:SAG31_NODE_6932_length_1845_cov_1.213058_2_plen_85_part_00
MFQCCLRSFRILDAKLTQHALIVQALRVLNLNGNNFPIFPSEVCGCGGLHELYLEQNGLKDLVPEIENLKQLKILALGKTWMWL